jgi:CheY-like chemotaxis protein
MSRVILLADDSVTIQKVIELTFMDEDYQVVSVSNGDDAVAKLAEVEPDIVISDVHMPGASGYDVCRHSKDQHPGVPVLLLVGTFEPFDEGEAEAAGADGFLKKPFDSQELLRRVAELLGGVAGDEGAAEPEAAAAAAAAAGEAAREEEEEEEERSEEPAPAEEQEPVAATAEADEEGGELDAWNEVAIAEDEGEEEEEAEAEAEEPVWANFDSVLDATPAATVATSSAAAGLETAPGEEEEEEGAAGAEPAMAEEELIATAAFAAEEEDYEDFAEEDDLAAAVEEPEDAPEPPPAAASDTRDLAADREPDLAAGPPPAVAGLSDEDVDRIARRVAQLIGDKAVREVAWEVIPDLAEIVIRERLQELESELEKPVES